MQNTSHAVMAQRREAKDSLDDFPTPPWATRALFEHIVVQHLNGSTCLEPTCGAGHMAGALQERFGHVHASGVHPYGYGEVRDFVENRCPDRSYDWVIINPPFKLAEELVKQSLEVAREGVAILARTVSLECISR